MSRRFAPFAKPVAREDRPDLVPEGAADPPPFDDYPPIEQFLDELPSIDDYLADAAIESVAEEITGGVDNALPDHDSEGWAMPGWQSYDWSGLAALATPEGRRSQGGASSGRSSWPNMQPEQETNGLDVVDSRYTAGPGGTSAEEVASVLDDLAYRIRSGELPIDQFTNQPPEAAMAAALAAMLRQRG
jgi:hypothetical protein